MKAKKIERMKKIEELENIILELENWNEGEKLREDTVMKIGNVVDSNHRYTLIDFIKGNIKVMRGNNQDDNKLYLTDIIKKENPRFESNNLILAPVGSGKTTLIEDILIKDQSGRILMLVSNTTLKNSVCPEDLVLRKEKGHRMYTTKNHTKYGKTEYEIHVMSYAEFGSRIKTNNDFVKDVVQIHCDEIHSLPDYQQYNDSVGLSHAIKYLFGKHDDKQIFYFTATDDNILDLEERQPGILRNVKTFDYREHKDIKRYMALSEYKINHIDQIRPHLKARLKSFNYFGYKSLAFSRTIASQKRIEEIAIEEGFTPLVLWSVNNNDKELKMTSEQLKARDTLINSGILPDPYNFLIINSAMQEGWDLDDDMVKLAIMNTTNETEHTQALGRIRNDVDILIYRTGREENTELEFTLDNKFINKPLTTDMKRAMCKEINLIDANGRVRKWNTIKRILIEKGYKVEDKKEIVDGKRLTVSIITIWLEALLNIFDNHKTRCYN